MTGGASSRTGSSKKASTPGTWSTRPRRPKAAVLVQCYFTLITMALCTAFRLQQARDAAEAQPADVAAEAGGPAAAAQAISSVLLGGEGTARWRRRLKQENRDQVIVFVGVWYGIFHLASPPSSPGRLQNPPASTRLAGGRPRPLRPRPVSAYIKTSEISEKQLLYFFTEYAIMLSVEFCHFPLIRTEQSR